MVYYNKRHFNRTSSLFQGDLLIVESIFLVFGLFVWSELICSLWFKTNLVTAGQHSYLLLLVGQSFGLSDAED
jgi:hypothetical protein